VAEGVVEEFSLSASSPGVLSGDGVPLSIGVGSAGRKGVGV